MLRRIGQVALGAFLLVAGTTHLTVARHEFQAQVPPWLPLDPGFVVIASGVVEIALGLALFILWALATTHAVRTLRSLRTAA
ncbi:hypothetical protein GCM10010435_07940 [Winogradskya consettensis]|uniref:Uncharacterized protein n=1 Tax=Winogradskya consettensis TaxID=113560 RepID=A0A919VVC4_9ACTN|nr:DoxX family membrane protein [Actinoplanes consettensis]GIM80424.1 hypothetical protein Aco04nite_70660 [Actinoplanes consettensis]